MSDRTATSTAVPVRHRGLRIAYVYGGSTAAWIGHLIFAASFVQYSCNVPGTLWYQHVATAFAAAICVHAAWVAYGLHREGQADAEDAGTPAGANNFVGLVGIIVALTNLLLILGEGSVSGLIRQGCHP